MTDNLRQTTNVTFVLLENMLATSATLPSEMLLAAQSAVARASRVPAPLNLRTVSPNGDSVVTRSGLRWQPDMKMS